MDDLGREVRTEGQRILRGVFLPLSIVYSSTGNGISLAVLLDIEEREVVINTRSPATAVWNRVRTTHAPTSSLIERICRALKMKI